LYIYDPLYDSNHSCNTALLPFVDELAKAQSFSVSYREGGERTQRTDTEDTVLTECIENESLDE